MSDPNNAAPVMQVATDGGSVKPEVWTPEEERNREVWKLVIDLQKHFNDIHFRLRAFYFGFLSVIATAVAALLFSTAMSEAKTQFPAGSLKRILLSVLLVTPGVAVWSLDRFYYHPLLVAAVDKAIEIEKSSPRLMSISTHLRSTNHASVFFAASRGRSKVTLFYALITAAMVGILNADEWCVAIVSSVVAGLLFYVFENSAEWWRETKGCERR
ncbi:hypothetical protein [Corallococcus exiguus]|uniref:Uncharacterized protein n=1 Tax=Corallococcus exiguus TaxID=83462 RepID=A0A7X5BYP0_9BACT|nr:hypothetical protein [Corallococcus exiguus]NBC45557.1 hypothetical protein [Corallococcus exiguus]TNV60397.1 hypothetical protein FH620_24430 [Corallococcus exiguus]